MNCLKNDKKYLQKHASQEGFTLIELSIVLVIIGLIVGGVLVGQDLIRAAEIRATVGQVEKYNSAVNTFRTKYNGLPGDIIETNAVSFGLYDSGATTTGKGDGNGIITDTNGTNANGSAGEPIMFWRHLSDASLIDGQYGAQLVAGSGGALVGTTVASYLPAAKMGRGNYIAAGSDTGYNYYLIGGVSTVAAANNTYTYAMTPIEAYNIDIKVDDGMPNTGIVQARGTANTNPFQAVSTTAVATYATNSTAGTCMMKGSGAGSSSDPTDLYNRNISLGGNSPACLIRYRFN